MKKIFKNKSIRFYTLILAFLIPLFALAQDGSQTIKLSLEEKDSTKTCKAIVLGSDAKPAQKVAVNFYIKRSVGLLPIATLQNTDENGEASAVFPVSIPGDTLGNVTVIARLEDDESILDQKTIAWGTKLKYSSHIDQRSLWASRSNAPTFLIIVSNAIITGIWGTVGYILFLLFFRMKKNGVSANTNTNKSTVS